MELRVRDLINQASSRLQYLSQRGFFDLLVVNILTQFLSFGSTLLVAKLLTPIELGEVKILQSYTAIFVIAAGFGLNSSVLKLCAEERPDEEKEGILRTSVVRTLYSTVVTLIVVLLLADKISTSQHLAFWLIVYSISIPLQAISGLLVVFLQARKQIKQMARAQAAVKLQSLVLIITSTWVWGFAGFIFATIVAYAIGLLSFLRQVGLRFLRVSLEKTPSQFMQYALFSFLANGVKLLGEYGDVFILDRYADSRDDIGYYALALIFIGAASQVTATVQSIVTPYFSQHAGDEQWYRRQLAQNQFRMVGLSILTSIAVYIVAWILVRFFYGSDYDSTLTILALLLVKYVIWSSFAVIGPALLGLGLMHYNFVAVAITTPVGLFLGYLLLQKFGVTGVAFAQIITASLTLFLLIFLSSLGMRRVFATTPKV